MTFQIPLQWVVFKQRHHQVNYWPIKDLRIWIISCLRYDKFAFRLLLLCNCSFPPPTYIYIYTFIHLIISSALWLLIHFHNQYYCSPFESLQKYALRLLFLCLKHPHTRTEMWMASPSHFYLIVFWQYKVSESNTIIRQTIIFRIFSSAFSTFLGAFF